MQTLKSTEQVTFSDPGRVVSICAKMGGMKKGSVVEVRWHDAGSGRDEDEAAAHIRTSVGYLQRRGTKGVWIAMESDALSDVHFIPAGMVIRVSRLRRKD